MEQMNVGSFDFGEGVEKYVVLWNAIHKVGRLELVGSRAKCKII